MYSDNLLQKSLNLESVIDRHPLVVHPEMLIVEAILIMNQSMDRKCFLPTADTSQVDKLLLSTSHSSVLVVENEQLVGIFTERDLVKLTAVQADWQRMKVAEVMTRDLRTIVMSAEQTVISALNILNRYQIRHLPVLDAQKKLLGIITPHQIRQILQPTDLLKFRSISEGMTAQVVHATVDTTILQIAQLMVEHRISSIVIVEGTIPLRPIGIVTEKDIVQFQVLELDLAQLTAGSVMSSPLFCLKPEDSLWSAQQMMESRRIRRLVVTGEQGDLQGIVTQSNLLRSFDPLEMIQVVDSLEAQLIDRTKELEQTNQELRAEVTRRQRVEDDLQQANQSLEERVVARTTELALLNAELQAKMREQQSCDIALEVSQQGISDFMENALIGMHWVDREGIIVWANQAELEMLGYDHQEYLGQPLVNFHIDKETIEDILQRLLNNEPIKGREAQMWHKGGAICHVSIDANAFFKDGRFIHARCFTRDITDQKNAEAALQQTLKSLEFEKYALDQAAIVAITDQHGKIIYINDKFSQISQYSATELLGKTHAVINSGYHPPEFFQDLWATISSGQVWSGEIRNRAKDGSYYWVYTTIVPFLDECRQPFQYLSIRFDITDRKAGEQKIQEQASLLNVATDAIIVRDLNNQIQFWNKGAEHIYGWSATEAIGLETRQLFYEDVLPEVIQASNTVRQEDAWQGELRKLTKTGQEVVVESRWSLVRDDAGQPKSILSVETDITEKKLLEKQFLRNQRLESLGALASGIAHDLNNVLTPIQGVAQLLPRTLPNLDERNQRLLTMLVESSKRGSSLVKQILTFARGMDGQRTVLQARHILAEIMNVARQTFPKSIEIILNTAAEELWMVSVDATQIHQVLMNLFVNARDAMPDGGTITATTSNLVVDETYAKMQNNARAGSYIVITIADTGMGMAPKTIDQIFDPFFTTKETGTGLGLSTVSGIIKAHGGFINVDSEIDRGTYFKIYLPAITNSEEEQPPVRPQFLEGNGQVILVVDDEVSVREISKSSLETYNYRVMLASDGVEGIALYAQHLDEISVVMLDMMMPNLDTPSVIRALQRINPAVKIIAMSGSAANEPIVQQFRLSAFMTKPFTITEVLNTLASLNQ
jgi:PAS domain S-box-containing protein